MEIQVKKYSVQDILGILSIAEVLASILRNACGCLWSLFI